MNSKATTTRDNHAGQGHTVGVSWRNGSEGYTHNHQATRWDGRVVPWPVEPQTWIPTRVGAALTACLRGREPFETIEWADLAEAIEAVQLLFDRPCAAKCLGEHVLVFTDSTAVHVRRVVGPSPPPRSLAAELRELYPSRLNGNGHGTLDSTPALWPVDPELNEPLILRGAPPMNPETERLKAQQDAAFADCHRMMTPEPGGLAGRVARAHDEAAEALAVGDIDGAIGADMLAASLSDAVLCEPQESGG